MSTRLDNPGLQFGAESLFRTTKIMFKLPTFICDCDQYYKPGIWDKYIDAHISQPYLRIPYATCTKRRKLDFLACKEVFGLRFKLVFICFPWYSFQQMFYVNFHFCFSLTHTFRFRARHFIRFSLPSIALT